jgi:hypothetical protein
MMLILKQLYDVLDNSKYNPSLQLAVGEELQNSIRTCCDHVVMREPERTATPIIIHSGI